MDEADPDHRDAGLNHDRQTPISPRTMRHLLSSIALAASAKPYFGLVLDRLQAFKAAGEPLREQGFVVHGTMADPKWSTPHQT